MSAYAALVSLLQILETILNSGGMKISRAARAQLESLQEKVNVLLKSLESSSSTSELEEEMRAAAYKAEDLLELQISRLTRPRRGRLGNHIINALCYIFFAYQVVSSHAVEVVSYPDVMISILVVVAVSTAIAEFARIYHHSGVISISEMSQEIEFSDLDLKPFKILVEEVEAKKIKQEAGGVDPKLRALISLHPLLDSILGSGRRRVSRNRAQLECLREKVSFLQDFLGNASADFISNLPNLDAAVYMAKKALFDFQFPDKSALDFFQWRRFSTLMNVSLHKLVIFPIALPFMIIRFINYHTSLRELIPICLGILRQLCIMFASYIVTAVLNLVISAARYNSETLEKRELRDAIDKFGIIELRDASEIPSGGGAALSRQASGGRGRDVVVGLDSDLIEIKGRLLQYSSNRGIISVVGMGGIGKTTLARQAYKDPDILTHFDVRAWVTVSQKYSLCEVLLCLLKSTLVVIEDSSRNNEEALGGYLHKYLMYRRYLIIMDDVWDTEIWDFLSRFLPENSNGSRVLLTSRLSDVAKYPDSSSPLHYMQCLDEDESWDLLREKIFGNEVCSPEFELIGKEIATSCKGLPLAIVVIGGLLHKDIRIEVWRDVSDKLQRSELQDIKEQCLKILGLSYNHLPHHLRPCLLYMGVFLADSEIPISRLINLWVAEGFLKPQKSKTLEEVAEGYLEDLINRNLILVRKRSCIGKMRTCSTHDLLRDVCVQNASEENFLHVVDLKGETPDESPRRLSIHPDALQVNATLDSVRSVFCIAAKPVDNPLAAYLGFVYLRVLDVLEVHFVEFPHQIIKLVLLRYLALHYDGPLPASISKLKYLETIVHHHSSSPNYPLLPSVIWSMPNLRHLYVKPGCYLFNPLRYRFLPLNSSFLPHLQTLVGLINFKWTKDTIDKIPHLQKLGMSYHVSSSADMSAYQLETLVYLRRLETLKIIIKYDNDDDDDDDNDNDNDNGDGDGDGDNDDDGDDYDDDSGGGDGDGDESDDDNDGDDDARPTTIEDPPILAFPQELRKLSLSGCRFPWASMRSIGALPNLEALKLRRQAFSGPSWKTVEGEFPKLVFLLLEEMRFRKWVSDEASHFPLLQHLVLRSCDKLERIPSSIGHIPTLEMIHLADCCTSAVASAEEIQKEQEDLENETLKFVIERRREVVDEMDLDARGVGPRAFQIVRDFILNAGIEIILVVSVLVIRWPFLSNKLKCLLGSDACVLLFSFL